MIVVIIALMFFDIRGSNGAAADNNADDRADNEDNSKGFSTDRGFVIVSRDKDDQNFDDEHSDVIIWQIKSASWLTKVTVAVLSQRPLSEH